MMDEKQTSGLCTIECVKKSDSLYPMYFGVSCAFYAHQLLSKPEVEHERWSTVCDKMLQGSAYLLGLLVWKVQRGASGVKCELLHKLETAEKEIEELKKMRREDAKANEKVVSIFAAQEQGWLNERKKLRQQIGALSNVMKVFEKKKGETISELNETIKELEIMVQGKDKVLEEEKQKKTELEETLKEAEKAVEDLRETATREAQEHSSELWRHKTAFIEVVSNQRQLEAEIGRLRRQVVATKQELDLILEQKEEAVLMAQKLSLEMIKLHKDLEQKDKILSAMLRKSKLDTAEKQMLLKEVKLSKAKRKQAELETERWRGASETRHERISLRSMLANQVESRSDVYTGARWVHSDATGSSNTGNTRSQSTDSAFGYGHLGLKKDRMEPEFISPLSHSFSPEGDNELGITTDVKQLESWVCSEAEKYAAVIQQRHHIEIDAFAEQMTIKDEKLEELRWQLMSTELESKRLQSQVERLNDNMSQLIHKNMKLEALLMEREEEMSSFREQLTSQMKCLNSQKINLKSFLRSRAIADDAICSPVKIMKGKPWVREQATNISSVDMDQGEDPQKEEEEASFNQSKDVGLTVQSPEIDLQHDEDFANEGPVQDMSTSPGEVDTAKQLTSPSPAESKTNTTLWRVDIYALGVSYKIKRLKQQLFMLERLTGKKESIQDTESNDNGQIEMKAFLSVMSLLNKQIGRYQSLQEKADDLCKRKRENDLSVNCGDASIARTKGETKTLEQFLDETFQLQRYIVATGQRLMEIQSNISPGFVGVAEELNQNASFDIKCFADSVRTLFQEVQRGLEVRIARIIGELEGTLAREGMIDLRR